MLKKDCAVFLALVFVMMFMGSVQAAQSVRKAPTTEAQDLTAAAPKSIMRGPGAGQFRLGPVELHPFVGIRETYDDNIYSSYNGLDKESDFITTLSPGIQFLLPFKSHNFQLNYRADIYRYSTNKETNYTSQLAGAEANFDFPMGLLVNVTDYYKDSEIPRKAKEQPGLTGAADIYHEQPYYSNDFNTKVKYKFADRWAAEVRYNNYGYEYKKNYDDAGSYRRNMGGGSIFYRFTPMTDALVEYNYSVVDYKSADINDNKNHSAYLGLAFEPSAFFDGYLKLGYMKKNYDRTVAGRENSFNTFSTLVDITYTISPLYAVILKVTRDIQEDIDTNAAFTNTTGTLGLRYKVPWNEAITVNPFVGYGTKKFDATTTDTDGTSRIRDDTYWSAGVNLGYKPLTWLSTNLNYVHTKNDSNFRKYDYSDNTVYLSVMASF